MSRRQQAATCIFRLSGSGLLFQDSPRIEFCGGCKPLSDSRCAACYAPLMVHMIGLTFCSNAWGPQLVGMSSSRVHAVLTAAAHGWAVTLLAFRWNHTHSSAASVILLLLSVMVSS
jgi:hypothetical protein